MRSSRARRRRAASTSSRPSTTCGSNPRCRPCSKWRGATSRVRVGPSCLNPFTLHPVEIAGQIAALDRASNGRAFLGLAAGAWLETARRSNRAGQSTTLREAWEVVRRLLAGDDDGFAGSHFTPAARCAAPVRRWNGARSRLLVGTWSPGSPRFAGTSASELKVGGSANPAVVRVMRERIGNDDVGIVMGAMTVVDDDGDRARALARREVAMYVDVIGGLRPDDRGARAARARRCAGRRGEDEAAGALLPEDLFRRFAFAGTPAEVAAQAADPRRPGRCASNSARRTASPRRAASSSSATTSCLDSAECSTTRNARAPSGRADGGRRRRRAVPRAVRRSRVPDRRRAAGAELRRGLVRARLGDRRVLPARRRPRVHLPADVRGVRPARAARRRGDRRQRARRRAGRSSSASPPASAPATIAVGDRVWAETTLQPGAQPSASTALRTGSRSSTSCGA